MMEILFRGKRVDNGEWVEGYYCKRKTGHYTNICFVEEYKDCIIKEFSDGGISWCDVAPETVCQYTGLTDKNGKKIFEGDIVRHTDEVTGKEKVDEVEYNETHAAFCRLHKSEIGLQYLFIDEALANRSVVVGNIFDNTEKES